MAEERVKVFSFNDALLRCRRTQGAERWGYGKDNDECIQVRFFKYVLTVID